MKFLRKPKKIFISFLLILYWTTNHEEISAPAKLVPPSLRNKQTSFSPPQITPNLKPRALVKPTKTQQKKPQKKKTPKTHASPPHQDLLPSFQVEPSLQETVDDQYDPARPNDYEKLLEERKEEKKRELEMLREREQELMESLKPKIAEFQPPASYFDEQMETKEEKALSRTEQNKKVDIRNPTSIGEDKSGKGNQIRKPNISRVVLLTNMVRPGEVDAELKGEIEEECSNYGRVLSVSIYEIKTRDVPKEEAVRIFVKFSNIEESTKAKNILQGRLFDGRLVAATFYDEEKFDRREYV